jgi:hypothetical protein
MTPAQRDISRTQVRGSFSLDIAFHRIPKASPLSGIAAINFRCFSGIPLFSSVFLSDPSELFSNQT